MAKPRGNGVDPAPEQKKWQFTFGDHVLSENDITVGQAERIEALTGESWLRINPLRSAKHARAIVVVMLADASGRDEEDVAAEIRAMKTNDFLNLLEYVDDDKPTGWTDGNPPTAAEPSTSSSSRSRSRRTSGPRP